MIKKKGLTVNVTMNDDVFSLKNVLDYILGQLE